MARLSQPVLLLLLLGSALAFRISQHHVHKKDGHDHDLKSDRSRQTQDNMRLEDTENSIPEDIELSNTKDTKIPEIPDAGTVDNNQEDIEDNNQEDPAENNLEDIEDNSQEDATENNQEDATDNDKEDNKDINQEDNDDNNHEDSEDIEVRNNPSIYAFYAELFSSVEIASGSTIVFDKVLVNEGGLYFGTSGQFACADDGVYVFVWSLLACSSSESTRGLGALAFGGENIKSGPQTSYYSSGYCSGNSQMVSVVQCRSSPITAVTVRSMHTSVPIYVTHCSSYAGFRLSPDAASAVAFTAELSKDVSLFPGTRILFDHVVSNLGGHYDNQNGYFRCPDNGVYSFSVSTYYPEASYQWSVSRLVFDGTSVFQGPMTYRATTTHDTGSSSVTVLMQCQPGGDFYVEAEQSYEFDYTEYGADLTSFSGFRLCSQCDDLVAFSAVLTENVTTNSVDIPFESVLLTRGDAYNPLTGVFTCPDDALYMFQWSATSTHGDCYMSLYVNDSLTKESYMTYTASSADSSGTSGTSSQSAMIRCSAGDTVSLRGFILSSSKILLAGYSTFSGYRLPGQ